MLLYNKFLITEVIFCWIHGHKLGGSEASYRVNSFTPKSEDNFLIPLFLGATVSENFNSAPITIKEELT